MRLFAFFILEATKVVIFLKNKQKNMKIIEIVSLNKELLNKSMSKFNYKQQYGVIVICKDEKEQREVYEMLQKLGLTLKVVTV
jgi:hypothetical protein